MSGELSDISGAVGEIAQGAAAASAVEPNADGDGTDSTGHTTENACLNCGTALVGAHCHSCGQKAKIHRTLRAFLNDLLHGVLHFEGKFWRTMPLLIWRPGRVMREYIDGKRATYVSPIALFLFTVFVSFAIFSLSGGFGDIKPDINGATTEQLQASLEDADASIADMTQQLADDGLSTEAKVDLREEIRAATTARDLLEQLVEASRDEGGSNLLRPSINIDEASLLGSGAEADAEPADSEDQAASDEAGNWLQNTWDKATSNPGLLLYKLQTNAYKLSWLLIPLSLPFVWILFPFSRKFRMYDHTVFVTYSISFMTMLIVIISVGTAYQFWPLIVIPLVYAPFHLYRSLRGTYDLSRFGAIWRMVALSAFIWIAMVLFVLIMFGIVVA